MPRRVGQLSSCWIGRCAVGGQNEEEVVIWWGPDKGRGTRVLLARKKYVISAPGLRALDGAGGKLNGRKRAECERDAPGGEFRVRLENLSAAGYEHHVDCHSHEESVYGAAGRDDQRASLIERRASEQPPSAGCRVECRLDARSDNRVAAGVPKNEGRLRRLKQRRQK